MFAPIRPSPTNPIRILRLPVARPPSVGALARVCGGSAAGERLAEGRFERDEPALRVGEVNPQDRQIVGLDRREVALGLGVDQAAGACRASPRGLGGRPDGPRSARGTSRSAPRPCGAGRSNGGTAGRSRRSWPARRVAEQGTDPVQRLRGGHPTVR